MFKLSHIDDIVTSKYRPIVLFKLGNKNLTDFTAIIYLVLDASSKICTIVSSESDVATIIISIIPFPLTFQNARLSIKLLDFYTMTGVVLSSFGGNDHMC